MGEVITEIERVGIGEIEITCLMSFDVFDLTSLYGWGGGRFWLGNLI